MKAIVINQQGGPDVLEWGNVTAPVPEAGEILVDIHAASVNSADWKVRKGVGPFAGAVIFPHVLGRDFSGTVSSVGEQVADFAAGDPVFGVLDAGKEGTYAEQLAIKASLVAPKPADLPHTTAAALALSGLTATVAIENTAKVAPGQTVLIHGGAGGVGSFAIQLAKHLGAEVWTTARTVNHAYVKSLGADQAIDYTKQDFTEVAPPCDVVFDTVGGDVHFRSLPILKPGGTLIYVAPPAPNQKPSRNDVEIVRPDVGRDRKHLMRILELVAVGAVHSPELHKYPLGDAHLAHAEIETGHARGKIVLQVR